MNASQSLLETSFCGQWAQIWCFRVSKGFWSYDDQGVISKIRLENHRSIGPLWGKMRRGAVTSKKQTSFHGQWDQMWCFLCQQADLVVQRSRRCLGNSARKPSFYCNTLGKVILGAMGSNVVLSYHVELPVSARIWIFHCIRAASVLIQTTTALSWPALLQEMARGSAKRHSW